jgi:hypothetical protein
MWIYNKSLNWFTFQKKAVVMEDKLKIKKLEKTMKEKKKRLKLNLILSHVNHTFLILNLQIEPQAFRYTHYTLRKSGFF